MIIAGTEAMLHFTSHHDPPKRHIDVANDDPIPV